MDESSISKTSATLLGKLKDPAEQQAWADFVQRYGGRIYAWCRRSGLSDADASDVLQEVLLRLIKRFPSFAYDRQHGKFRNFLRTVTENVIRDFLRQHKYRADRAVGGSTVTENLSSAHDLTDAIGELIEELDAEVRRDMIVEFLKDLKERRANQSDLDAFELCDLQGLSHAEAAERLGKSLGAIYAALSRGRKKVSDELTKRMLPESM